MDTALYHQKLLEHYTSNWGQEYNVLTWENGPYKDLGDHFRILEFPPNDRARYVGLCYYGYVLLGR